jgi:hypothetical protein
MRLVVEHEATPRAGRLKAEVGLSEVEAYRKN